MAVDDPQPGPARGSCGGGHRVGVLEGAQADRLPCGHPVADRPGCARPDDRSDRFQRGQGGPRGAERVVHAAGGQAPVAATARDFLIARVSRPGPQGAQLADVLRGCIRPFRPRFLTGSSDRLEDRHGLLPLPGRLHLAGHQRLGRCRAPVRLGAGMPVPHRICLSPQDADLGHLGRGGSAGAGVSQHHMQRRAVRPRCSGGELRG